MRSTFVRRSVIASTAVSLALLGTACGKSEDKTADAKPSAASSSAPAAAAAKGKTDAELTPLLLAEGDVKDHAVKPATPAEAAAGLASTSDKAECKPLVQAQSFGVLGTPSGSARTKAAGGSAGKSTDPGASPEDKLKAGLEALGSTNMTAITLTSYDAKGAEEAFASVKAAGTACAGGYTATQAGEPTKVTAVAPGAAVSAGDEAASYTITLDGDGTPITTQLVVVRKGNTLATFAALNLGGKADQPTAVIDAQVKKLG
ncbi:hypothetical protein [Streptomyces sp. NPDC089799]|uniref:hypothetical protein n=1 Tax=Streptomyces sp. NPDC089799 TaxID=3155066 RepID=UPI003440891D